LIVLLLATLAAGQAPSATDELTQIQHRLMKAWVDGDREYVDRTLASDWTTTDTTGHVLTKAQVVQEVFGSDVRRIESGAIDDIKVRLLGYTTAIVTGHTTAVGTYKGSKVTANLRFTDVFVKRDGRWQAVASQGTMITP
jgi:uncharacterized protein (TIGR02246 family)